MFVVVRVIAAFCVGIVVAIFGVVFTLFLGFVLALGIIALIAARMGIASG